jgi:hypothetical protein
VNTKNSGGDLLWISAGTDEPVDAVNDELCRGTVRMTEDNAWYAQRRCFRHNEAIPLTTRKKHETECAPQRFGKHFFTHETGESDAALETSRASRVTHGLVVWTVTDEDRLECRQSPPCLRKCADDAGICFSGMKRPA